MLTYVLFMENSRNYFSLFLSATNAGEFDNMYTNSMHPGSQSVTDLVEQNLFL